MNVPANQQGQGESGGPFRYVTRGLPRTLADFLMTAEQQITDGSWGSDEQEAVWAVAHRMLTLPSEQRMVLMGMRKEVAHAKGCQVDSVTDWSGRWCPNAACSFRWVEADRA